MSTIYLGRLMFQSGGKPLFQTAADISDRPSPSISRKILSADSGSSIGAKVDWNAPIYPITKA